MTLPTRVYFHSARIQAYLSVFYALGGLEDVVGFSSASMNTDPGVGASGSGRRNYTPEAPLLSKSLVQHAKFGCGNCHLLRSTDGTVLVDSLRKQPVPGTMRAATGCSTSSCGQAKELHENWGRDSSKLAQTVRTFRSASVINT